MLDVSRVQFSAFFSARVATFMLIARPDFLLKSLFELLDITICYVSEPLPASPATKR